MRCTQTVVSFIQLTLLSCTLEPVVSGCTTSPSCFSVGCVCHISAVLIILTGQQLCKIIIWLPLFYCMIPAVNTLSSNLLYVHVYMFEAVAASAWFFSMMRWTSSGGFVTCEVRLSESAITCSRWLSEINLRPPLRRLRSEMRGGLQSYYCKSRAAVCGRGLASCWGMKNQTCQLELGETKK